MDHINLSSRAPSQLLFFFCEYRSCVAPIWWAISIPSPEFVSWWSIHFRGVIMCIRLLIWKTLNSSIFLHPFSNSTHWENPGDTKTALNCPHSRQLLITPGALDLVRKSWRSSLPFYSVSEKCYRERDSLVTLPSGSCALDKQTRVAAHQSAGWEPRLD